jgi:hypothetical protein
MKSFYSNIIKATNGTYHSSEEKISDIIIGEREKSHAKYRNIVKLTSFCMKADSFGVFLQYIMSGITVISTDIKQIIYIFFEGELISDCQRQFKGLLKSQPHLYFKKLSLSSISLKGDSRGGEITTSNNENSINNKYKKVCRFFITKCRG